MPSVEKFPQPSIKFDSIKKNDKTLNIIQIQNSIKIIEIELIIKFLFLFNSEEKIKNMGNIIINKKITLEPAKYIPDNKNRIKQIVKISLDSIFFFEENFTR